MPEELEEILDAAGDAGFDVSRHQLERWRGKGLVPRPRREGLGYREGTDSYYPKGTSNLVIRIAQLLEEKRSFEFVGWMLWGMGYNHVVDFVRSSLRNQIEKAQEQGESQLQEIFSDDADGESASLSRTRRALAKKVGAPFADTAIRIISEVESGRFSPNWLGGPGEMETDLEILRKLFLDEREMLEEIEEEMGDKLPLLRSPIQFWKFFLTWTSLLGGAPNQLDALERSSDEDLLQIRDEALAGWTLFHRWRGVGFVPLPRGLFKAWLSIRKGNHPFTERLQEIMDGDEIVPGSGHTLDDLKTIFEDDEESEAGEES